jgi:hypothetical protein
MKGFLRWIISWFIVTSIVYSILLLDTYLEEINISWILLCFIGGLLIDRVKKYLFEN